MFAFSGKFCTFRLRNSFPAAISDSWINSVIIWISGKTLNYGCRYYCRTIVNAVDIVIVVKNEEWTINDTTLIHPKMMLPHAQRSRRDTKLCGAFSVGTSFILTRETGIGSSSMMKYNFTYSLSNCENESLCFCYGTKEDLNWIPFINCYSFAEIFIQARTLRIDIAVFIYEFSGLRYASIDIDRMYRLNQSPSLSKVMNAERKTFQIEMGEYKNHFHMRNNSIHLPYQLSAQLYLFMELIFYAEFEDEYTCRLLNGCNEKGIDVRIVHLNQPKRNSPADSVLRLDSTQILWFLEIYTSAMHPIIV